MRDHVSAEKNKNAQKKGQTDQGPALRLNIHGLVALCRLGGGCRRGFAAREAGTGLALANVTHGFVELAVVPLGFVGDDRFYHAINDRERIGVGVVAAVLGGLELRVQGFDFCPNGQAGLQLGLELRQRKSREGFSRTKRFPGAFDQVYPSKRILRLVFGWHV